METFISADASSYGLGSVLCQKNNGHLHSVFYTARILSDTEKRLAQIEKEALATVGLVKDFLISLPDMMFTPRLIIRLLCLFSCLNH